MEGISDGGGGGSAGIGLNGRHGQGTFGRLFDFRQKCCCHFRSRLFARDRFDLIHGSCFIMTLRLCAYVLGEREYIADYQAWICACKFVCPLVENGRASSLPFGQLGALGVQCLPYVRRYPDTGPPRTIGPTKQIIHRLEPLEPTPSIILSLVCACVAFVGLVGFIVGAGLKEGAWKQAARVFRRHRH